MPIGFYYLVPVWGKEYIDTFLNLSLPTQLSPNNFSESNFCTSSKYIIYTFEAHCEQIKQNVNIQNLSEKINIEYIFLDKVKEDSTHDLMSWCHNHGINQADTNDCASVFWAPDFLYGNGCVQRISVLVSQGKRTVFTVGIRTNKEGAAKDIEKWKEKDCINIEPRALVDLTLKNLHQIAYLSFWGKEYSNDLLPSNLFWPVKNEGLLCHAFHLHPLVIYPSIKHVPIQITVDADYVLKACPDIDTHYIVKDSDELYLCELSTETRIISGASRTSLSELGRWIKLRTNQQHRLMVKENIRIHTGIKDNKEWKKIEANASEIVTNILQYFDKHVEQSDGMSERFLTYFPSFMRFLINIFKNQIGTKRYLVTKIKSKLLGGLRNPTIGNPYWIFCKLNNKIISGEFENKKVLMVNYDSTSPFHNQSFKNQINIKMQDNIVKTTKKYECIILSFGKNEFNISPDVVSSLYDSLVKNGEIVVVYTGKSDNTYQFTRGFRLLNCEKTGAGGSNIINNIIMWIREQYKVTLSSISSSRVLSMCLSVLFFPLISIVNILSILLDKIDRTESFSTWCATFIKKDIL